jgi:hypothetical protein
MSLKACSPAGHLSDEEEGDEDLDDETPGKGPTPRFEGSRQIIDARFLAHLESALQIVRLCTSPSSSSLSIALVPVFSATLAHELRPRR